MIRERKERQGPWNDRVQTEGVEIGEVGRNILTEAVLREADRSASSDSIIFPELGLRAEIDDLAVCCQRKFWSGAGFLCGTQKRLKKLEKERWEDRKKCTRTVRGGRDSPRANVEKRAKGEKMTARRNHNPQSLPPSTTASLLPRAAGPGIFHEMR